jgi:hypothetical protein
MLAVVWWSFLRARFWWLAGLLRGPWPWEESRLLVRLGAGKKREEGEKKKERKALERSLEVDDACRFVRVNVGGDHLGKLEMWACLRRRG